MRTISLGSRQGIRVESELERFLWLRAWLIARFGFSDDTVALAAITLYRTTLHPKLVQIHVRTPEYGKAAPSFTISRAANDMLGQAGFWRWRYASVEEADGQYRQTPLTLLHVWKEDSDQPGPAQAALFTTNTMIAGKLDSTTFFLARRDKNGQWQLYRAWQMECPPHSRAWALGNAKLSQDVLPGVAKLKPMAAAVHELITLHGALVAGNHPYAFCRGASDILIGRELNDRIIREIRRNNPGPEILARRIDFLLTHRK